jgi:hypothetical protein
VSDEPVTGSASAIRPCLIGEFSGGIVPLIVQPGVLLANRRLTATPNHGTQFAIVHVVEIRHREVRVHSGHGCSVRILNRKPNEGPSALIEGCRTAGNLIFDNALDSFDMLFECTTEYAD